MELYNHMTTSEGKEIIFSGRQESSITNTNRLGQNQLPGNDPFKNINPMLAPQIHSNSEKF